MPPCFGCPGPAPRSPPLCTPLIGPRVMVVVQFIIFVRYLFRTRIVERLINLIVNK